MRQSTLSHDELAREFQQQLTGLWPALKGSLAQVHKPCIRKHCPTCAQGDKHPAWILAFRDKNGRRRCMYVPEALVPTLRQALKNGRKLEELLCRMGPALINAHRQQRDKSQHSVQGKSKSL